MPRIEEQVDIKAAPSDVFRFCHDVERRPEWDERVASVKVLSGTPIRRGTLVRIDAQPPRGPVFSWEGEYVEFQFPSRSEVRVIDAAPSSYFRAGSEVWQVSSSGGDARFTVAWDYEPRGILGRILDVLGGRARVRRAIGRSLANLKQAMEAKT